MNTFAVLINNVVSNVIVADDLVIAQEITGQMCIEVTHLQVGIGWTYDGTNFIEPMQNLTEITID